MWRYSSYGEGSRMFRINVAKCRPRAVSDRAPSADTEATGPELFKPCSEIGTRPRPPTAREGSGPTRPLIAGTMALWAAVETASPMAELPPPDVKRWTVRRKAAVVTAVAEGVADSGGGLPPLPADRRRVRQLAAGVRGARSARSALDPVAAISRRHLAPRQQAGPLIRARGSPRHLAAALFVATQSGFSAADLPRSATVATSAASTNAINEPSGRCQAAADPARD